MADGDPVTRRATIAALHRDIEDANRDMWLLAGDLDDMRADRDRLQAIVERQDLTIMALWHLLEQQEQFIDSCDYHMKDGVTITYQGARP